MTQVVTVECPAGSESVCGSELKIGEFGIIVDIKRSSCTKHGDVVMGGANGEIYFPGVGLFSSDPTKYTVRRLRPGERVVIENKG